MTQSKEVAEELYESYTKTATNIVLYFRKLLHLFKLCLN